MLATALSASAAGDSTWHHQVDWQGHQASMQVTGDSYLLNFPGGSRHIAAGAASASTASPLFDGLFAMAQDDLKLDSVTSIQDGAFDHGQPMPCHCFETGLKWPYVWTRDLSYSVDLGLWRFDPARARNGLLFKLSGVRAKDVPQGLYPMQDTGSGGSWPISTDRIVWFLGARHLLGDKAFADKVWTALGDTLAQDRQYIFDPAMGLYRGETSFLDWREQTYPAWTANNVVFIAQSFSLSTNVLHYEALKLAAALAAQRGDARAATWRAQATALKKAINEHFWRASRGLYMSYIGGDGQPMEAYDLLGIALAVTSGVADPQRARETLANYPIWPSGSPVIWPERADQPIYHNRAIWPFVSAYALRAARVTRQPELIARELHSIMRGAAMNGSNMENFSLVAQSIHVDEGKLSGPVVDSPRQLWSVAAYLDAVTEGVFGLENDGHVNPELPVSLVPMLFGSGEQISLQLPGRKITLIRPASLDGNLLVTDHRTRVGHDIVITLKAIHVDASPLATHAPMYAPATPAAPTVTRVGDHWRIRSAGQAMLYVNGRRHGPIDGSLELAHTAAQQCFDLTRIGKDGVESLPSRSTCVGTTAQVAGAWPRSWRAPSSGRFRIWLDYDNPHGPINTGISAGVKKLDVKCSGEPAQVVIMVMPHSVGRQDSTTGRFMAKAGARCSFALAQGFNMSDLAHFSHYTGGTGGSSGPLNSADIGALHIAPLADDAMTH
ncbi:Six-hairpin glycosidase-like protein [Dyella sp. A6]|uniref:alpha-L-rhamnosidase-related protein n=1 Tax=Dyella aluminiiresistens TaxID=3069105 RepID=UPI002E7638AD|nr:Six-hairpin glycosidase-like protein [Dyella sp. A6]